MNRRKLVIANNPLLKGPALDERQHAGSPYRELSLSNIDRDPKQPRLLFDEQQLGELSRSIQTYGVLSPIIVQPSKTAHGRFQLVAGERRLRAAQMAGLQTIPALVKPHNEESSEDVLAIQLVENLQRADLSPLERAQAIGALKDTYKLSVRDIAEKLGVSKSMVQRSLEILSLPDDLLNALKSGASESKVLLLAKIDDIEIRASYLKDIDSLTRNQLEKNVNGKAKENNINLALSAEDSRISDELQRSLGLRVRLLRTHPGNEGGRLVIEFYSSDDLQEVFRKLVH